MLLHMYRSLLPILLKFQRAKLFQNSSISNKLHLSINELLQSNVKVLLLDYHMIKDLHYTAVSCNSHFIKTYFTYTFSLH